MSQEQDIQTLIRICNQQEKQIESQEKSIRLLEEQLAYMKRMMFGKKSERFVDPNQLSLGLGIEETTPEAQPEPLPKETVQKKNKKRPVRQPIPKDLPRVIEIIDPENLLEGCKKIGEEVSETLEYTPGRLWVRKIVRPKYALPNEAGVVIADMPSLPIPKGNAGASLLAHIAVAKFADHIPFYRLQGILKRSKVTIAESTINSWVTATFKLISPLYDCMVKQTLESGYVQGDETPIPVLTDKKPGSTHQGYHWVYHSPERKAVFFDYNESRGRAAPENILKDFKGTLQTDGYVGYLDMKTNHKIELIACMAHARRYFEKAFDNDPDRAKYALSKIQELYAIERECEKMNNQQRMLMRSERSVPILQEMKKWLWHQDNLHLLPKSYIGKAFTYARNFWEKLSKYTQNGKYRIDNNPVENTIRPVALGRKNYLFAGSHQGAKRAAVIYSFMGTCKLNNIDPYEWMTDVLNRLPDHKANKLHELLPGNWNPRA
ncbi:Transposase [Saccharicrinis carchari]|uniref:Transposase n=1 Tax=Saccharicrinis carchari TaxID=1168039 RepID=A0A521FFM3_SACCC|nr:IS66 family transposase [Saccharicrinis carchari]SMO94983.1 Transposase [Saccharicrinis carchari]